MPSLSQIIQHIYPTANLGLGGDVAVCSDENGEHIARWNEAVLGPQPTPEFLESKRAETEAARDAQAEIESLETANQATLEANLGGLLAQLRTYQGTASPSPTTTTATVKLLCRAMIFLVRLQLRKLEAVN